MVPKAQERAALSIMGQALITYSRRADADTAMQCCRAAWRLAALAKAYSPATAEPWSAQVQHWNGIVQTHRRHML